jgi:hypothetical protein
MRLNLCRWPSSLPRGILLRRRLLLSRRLLLRRLFLLLLRL